MMNHRLDFVLFGLYLLFNIGLGLWVARRKTGGTRGYFLAGEGLPWYTIGGSIIASNISTEHFIGMIGVAYAVGFVVAQWEWGNWFTFTALIWIFLPYYIRGGLYTMPEFLERRYNAACRYLFAICSLVLWVIAQMAVVMLAGGKAMKGMFGLDETTTIVCLALLAGSYTIYGGLISVAWTDFLQFVVMMLGGLVVTVLGLHQVGGLGELMHAAPEKFKIIYPITDKDYPWFGVWTLFISIGIWYNCSNQFIVQRCLGARSEWDARMGVVFAGFMKILLPLLVVVPGIVAFKLYPGLPDKDQAFPTLVRELVPVGLSGIVMAGLASGMLSHISSVLNSCSTVFTMDLYRPLLGRERSEAHLVLVGRASAFVILAVATGLALWFTRRQLGVFDLIQNIGAWVAAPIAAIFLLGVLWERANAVAATTVLVLAFPYTWLVESVLFKRVPWLQPFDNWLNRTFVVWATCMALTVIISLLTRPPDPVRIRGMIWSWDYARLPEAERTLNRGVRNLFLWWCLFVGTMAVLYAYVIWFQFWGPASR
ncbi:MAG: sodium/solute symporter [Verrucomicrobia bacterium]|mgnify:CR=1 FL=1|jgi:SSS family solute:Na+ symporter|nr:sodium/solute symporter [Verrucomicrobiota bacterium]OQC62573.1 MAG: Sodium/glucose cotransporter [Verrucomicrobia bacterium ADurb.Bin006]MDI9380616.1 sodium/solute symporter [Verrucomicrobiota bacterium]NMD20447.1 sodium/solute symporter [Verrucomicrobiota bacterium]HOA59787.1 sodium/solute symporter [Verrucomicrobiota bacterium]